MGALIPTGALDQPLARFDRVDPDSFSGLGTDYYTSDPDEIKELIKSEDFAL